MKSLISSMGLAAFAAASAVADVPTGTSAHQYSFTRIDGQTFALSEYAGKAVLVVNTASRCGFTGQYDGLQTLWETYGDQGLVVLGVPSNSFKQELSADAEVKDFCEVNFGISFPMTSITPVKGEQSHDFFDWVRAESGNKKFPSWNFNKILLNGEGALVGTYGARTGPKSKSLVADIEKSLPTTNRAAT